MTELQTHRVGEWLPQDHDVMRSWLADLIAEVQAAPPPLHPAVEPLARLIDRDPTVYMLFHQMLTQVPHKPPYEKDPTGEPQVRDVGTLLRLFSAIMTRAPQYNDTGLVGFPINAILDWAMGTAAGSAAFLHPGVNKALRVMLDGWGEFLAGPASCAVLDARAGGWFSPDALEHMAGFAEDFVCDPAAPHHGFTSWDDFFTRRFRPGRRPIGDPDDPGVVVNACESAPYAVAYGVKAHDEFWIKTQPYSVEHMLARDPQAAEFVGGTIYQAFLSALSYHRWHSPVDGTIVRTKVVPGSYYAEALSEGFDPAGPNDSQGFITQVATRAVVMIEADDPAIGLMCFLPVGMAEVSTCDVTVEPGQHVRKGDELGMFHFGGSTHCLLFRAGVRLAFDLHGQTPGLAAGNIPVNARLATVIR